MRHTGTRKLKVGGHPKHIKDVHHTKKSKALKVKGASTLKGNRFTDHH